MLASLMTIRTIVGNFENRPQKTILEGEGWCDDQIAVIMTVEELENLRALAKYHPKIKPTEEELPCVD